VWKWIETNEPAKMLLRFLRFHTAAGDDVGQYLCTIKTHVCCECHQAVARILSATDLAKEQAEGDGNGRNSAEGEQAEGINRWLAQLRDMARLSADGGSVSQSAILSALHKFQEHATHGPGADVWERLYQRMKGIAGWQDPQDIIPADRAIDADEEGNIYHRITLDQRAFPPDIEQLWTNGTWPGICEILNALPPLQTDYQGKPAEVTSAASEPRNTSEFITWLNDRIARLEKHAEANDLDALCYREVWSDAHTWATQYLAPQDAELLEPEPKTYMGVPGWAAIHKLKRLRDRLTGERPGTNKAEGTSDESDQAEVEHTEWVNSSTETKWLTVSDAAKASGCTAAQISGAVRDGRLKSNGKKGRERRIDAADLTLWQLRRSNREGYVESDATVAKRLKRAQDAKRNSRSS
jgi:hypothetical protein